MTPARTYLVDTDVVSEVRKRRRANPGVRRFFANAHAKGDALYLSVVTVGEIRRGIESIRHRGDSIQADQLDAWLTTVLNDFADHILDFAHDEAQVWGRLRVPHPENAIDKQIAATALTHGLTLVTRNTAHFSGLGVTVLNPFT
ncbi:MAG: recombinase [Betaproteobacteria bacterium RIFCSPLOWO2_12_FULL_63_13]|nr:MAG: recombinase [Betaproteobacteria bacterium RIFCSPLOWO2_02_FULL_63_19]OGA47033.1 MAG: recombinase [Betaproteobacteria bacterium RIFCSPLOWO2_12_FULL_63_13]